MPPHRRSGTGAIMRLDRVQDLCMLGNHLRYAPRLRQGEATVAIDMDLDLLDQRPDSRISRDLGNGCVKSLIRLVKSLAVGRRIRLALALQERMQAKHLAGCRAFGS